jgi:hypothetical protein
MALLIMVTLPTMSSFSSERAVAGPRRPPLLMVTSLDLMNLSRE